MEMVERIWAAGIDNDDLPHRSMGLRTAIGSLFSSTPKIVQDGIRCDERSRRFGDRGLEHLRDAADISQRDMEIYGRIISALLDISHMFTEAAGYCRRFDHHLALQRIGIERATLAAMMTARVERLGFKLTVRPGRFVAVLCLLRGLADRLANTDAPLIARLARAEDRLNMCFRQGLADPRLGLAVAELIESALRTAAPGRTIAALSFRSS